MSKRAKFLIVGLITGLLLWFSSMASVDYRFGFMLAVSGVSYILSAWVLFDDLKGVEWITLLVLPVMFTLGSGFFANFLPVAIPGVFRVSFDIETAKLLASLIKVTYFLLFSMGLYGILLIENIFSVASIRTIQLFRAARSANFVFTLVTSLFFYTMFLSLKLQFWQVFLFCMIVTMILAFPNYWSVDLKKDNIKETLLYSFVTSWIVSIVSLVLCFWPAKPFMAGLMTTSVFYSLLGILEQRFSSRVYVESLLGYVSTVVIIMAVGFLTTSWTG